MEKSGEDKSNTGILMMIIATICFSLVAVMVKSLSYLPVMEIVFFRNIPTMLIIPLILKNKKISFWGNNKPLLLFRSLLSCFGVVSYFYTITVMVLTDAVTIKQLSPIFILLLASIFLGEKIDNKKIIIFALAFLGALLVVKPGFYLDIFPAVIALLGAIVTAGSHVAVRSLRLTDHPLVIVNYFGYSIGIISLGILFWQGNFIIPDAVSLVILLLMGLVGLAGQFALTKAYQKAPTKLISLYLYLQIIFGAILGILFFKETPDLFSIFGAFLIIICGYLNYKFKTE